MRGARIAGGANNEKSKRTYMRVSFIEPHLEVFGGIRRVIEISNHLAGGGDEVSIYHPEGTPCAWMECAAKVKKLDEIFFDKHDVIVFNDPPHFKIARKIKAGLKVFYILGLYEKSRLEKYSLKILWPKKGREMSIKRSLKLPFLKIASATWISEYLTAKLHVACEVVPGGINKNVFHPVSNTPSHGKIRILSTGDPREYKGMRTVIQAFEIIKKKYSGISLETYYGRNIPQELMAKTYGSADIFVDAQWGSGCGWNNPVAEAMACKVPVVCSDIGGVKDFAFHERTALIVPEKNVVETAGALMRLIRDERLRDDLSRRAYNHISRFTWADSAEKFRSIITRSLETLRNNS